MSNIKVIIQKHNMKTLNKTNKPKNIATPLIPHPVTADQRIYAPG